VLNVEDMYGILISQHKRSVNWFDNEYISHICDVHRAGILNYTI